MNISTSNSNLFHLANFCIKELKIELYDATVVINEVCLKEDKVKGWTQDISYESYDSEIYVDVKIDKNLPQHEKLLTLCHEMVHVRQACRGDEIFSEDEANALEEKLYEQYKIDCRVL